MNHLNKNLSIRITESQDNFFKQIKAYNAELEDLGITNFTMFSDELRELFDIYKNYKLVLMDTKIPFTILKTDIKLLQDKRKQLNVNINEYKQLLEDIEAEDKRLADLINEKNIQLRELIDTEKNKENELNFMYDNVLRLIKENNFNELELEEILENKQYLEHDEIINFLINKLGSDNIPDYKKYIPILNDTRLNDVTYYEKESKKLKEDLKSYNVKLKKKELKLMYMDIQILIKEDNFNDLTIHQILKNREYNDHNKIIEYIIKQLIKKDVPEKDNYIKILNECKI